MNEEEKKAVEYLEKYTKWETYGERNLEKDIITTLNLIEKLQKENKELNEYIAIAPNLDEMTAVKYRNIREDAYIQGRAEEQQRAEQIIYENYIPTQKVKDKIEEFEKEGIKDE